MAQAQDLMDVLKQSLTNCKHNFTRFCNEAGRTSAYAKQYPTTDSATAVRKCQGRVDKAFTALCDAFDAISVASDDKKLLDDIEKQKDDCSDLYGDITDSRTLINLS